MINIHHYSLPANFYHQEISKQAVTGRTKDDTVFPLTVKFTDVSQNLSVGDLYSPSCTFDRQEQLPLQNKVRVTQSHAQAFWLQN